MTRSRRTPGFGSVDEVTVPVPAVRFGGGRGQGMQAGSVDADSTSHDWPTADDGAVVSGRPAVVLRPVGRFVVLAEVGTGSRLMVVRLVRRMRCVRSGALTTDGRGDTLKWRRRAWKADRHVLARGGQVVGPKPQGWHLNFLGCNNEEGGLNPYGPRSTAVFEVQVNHTRGAGVHGDVSVGPTIRNPSEGEIRAAGPSALPTSWRATARERQPCRLGRPACRRRGLIRGRDEVKNLMEAEATLRVVSRPG